MKHEERDLSICQNILSEISKLHRFAGNIVLDDFLENEEKQYAVAMAFINIGEYANRLSPTFQMRVSTVPWHKIRAMRNLFAHQYDSIDMHDIWVTLQKDIPMLEEILLQAAATLGGN